jgi:methionyl-tRNA synthetase
MAYNDKRPSGDGPYVLPENVPANEYLNLEGLKFSTSRNFAVWLHDCLEQFDPDPLRYYLCANMPENRDTDFNLRQFQAHNNNELADTVGNFVNRTLTFVERYFAGKTPEAGNLGQADRELLARIDLPAQVGTCIDSFRFRAAVDCFTEFARSCNKYFNDKAPWASRGTDPADCATTLNLCVQAAHALSVAMWPLMPFSAEKLWAQLGLSTDWRDHPWEQDYANAIQPGHAIGKVEVLFPKIEDSRIEAGEKTYKGQAAEPEKAAVEEEPLAPPVEVEFEDFARLDIRVAVVVAAEPVPKSDRLLKLTLDLGPLGARSVAAGIAKHYRPGELIGRKVLVAANLKPRKVRGIESRGMVLAALHEDSLALTGIDPAKDLPPGAKIS